MKSQSPMAQRHGGTRIWILIVLIALVGVGGYFGYQRYSERTQLRARLPELPERSGQSTLFNDALAQRYERINFLGEVDTPLREIAMLYHANRFYEKALSVYEIVREREPENAEIVYLVSDVHQSRYDFDSLKRTLERSMGLGLEYGPALVKLGRLAIKEGKLEKAEDLFKRAVQADPKSTLPYDALAALYLRTGDSGKKQAVEAHRDRVATAILGQNDPLLEPVYDFCYDPSQLLVRVDLWMDRGDFQKADHFLDRAIAIDGSDWKALAVRMILEFRKGDVEASIEAGLAAVEQGADAGTAMAQIANMLTENGELERAEDLLRQAIEKYPDQAQLYQSLATVQKNRERYAMAYQSLLKAEKGLPKSAEIYQLKGDLLWAMGKRDEAAIYFREAVSLSPLDNISITYLIQYYIEKGRLNEAEPLVDRALAIESGNEELRALAASYFADYGSRELGKGNHADAIRLLRNASRLSPVDSRLQQTLADALFKGGQTEEGLAILKGLVDAGSAAPEVYMVLGELAFEEKDFLRARQYFSEAVARGRGDAGYDPLVAAAKARLERIERETSKP